MIKNVWFGITAFIVFVIALSIGGNIVGYGNVYEWSKNLEQCGGKGFYFPVKEKDVDQLKDTYTTPSTAYVFCCENDGATYERGWKAVDYRQTAEVFTYTAECEKIENISY